MRKIIFIVMLFQLNTALVAENTLIEADKLFEKNLYDQALNEYEKIIKISSGEDKLKTLYRAIECEGLLFKYGEAVKRAFGIDLPQDEIWKARFLLLRAEIAREFLNHYGYSLPTDLQEGIDYKEPEKMTRQQWFDKINASYNEIYRLREKLINVPLRTENYFIDLKNADTSYINSLWDFIVFKWVEFLKTQHLESQKLPLAEIFLADKYEKKFDDNLNPIEKIAVLYEQSSYLEGKDRQVSKEYWKLKRFLLPFELSHLVKTTSEIYDLAIDKLKSLMNSFITEYAKSEAGYEVTNLLNQKGKYKETVELCKRIEKDYPGTNAAKKCSKMRAQIEMPSLNLSGKFVPPPGKNAVSINVKNIETVFFRIYKTSIEDLKEKSGKYYSQNESWGFLKYLSPETLEKFINTATPLHSWSVRINYTVPYSYENKDIDIPALKQGIYIIAASNEDSFSTGKSIINGAILNITSLILLGSSGINGHPSDFLFDPLNPLKQITKPVFHLYAINGITGQPQENVKLEVIKKQNYGNSQKVYLNSDLKGMADLSLPLRLSLKVNNSYSIDPLAYKDENYAWWFNEEYIYYTPSSPLEVFIDLDRPIYRPGQKVGFKVTVLQKVSEGYKVYTGNSKVTVTARDANYNEFFKKELQLNEMGSIAGSFNIPADRLLGNYNLSANITEFGNNYYSEERFSVEEYKRPEFEVLLDTPKDSWKYGEKVKITGSVKYYFGGAVPNAVVNYKIYRQRYIPWFCWWWRWFYPPAPRNEFLSGNLKTDDKGNFFFEFIPDPENENYKEYPSNFVVEVEARDSGGRTINASKTYTAGSKAYLFDIKPQKGFFTEKKNSEIEVRLLNLNEKQLSGEGEYEVYEVGEKVEKKVSKLKRAYRASSLEEMYANSKNGKKVFSGKVNFNESKPSIINLDGIKEGIYSFVIKANDPFGGISEQSVILVCVGEKGLKNKDVPDITISEYKNYKVGEKAAILLGSSELKGAKYIEIWKGNFLLDKTMIKDEGVSLFKLPIENKHKGEIIVRWFGVENFNLHSGQVKLEVPEKEKELEVNLKYDKVIEPGKKVFWTLFAKDINKSGINGEGFIKIFDRSLEYYQKDYGHWLDSLYKERGSPDSLTLSMLTSPITSIYVKEGWLKKMMELFRFYIKEPVLPALRINKAQYYGHFLYKLGSVAGGEMEEEVSDKVMPQAVMADVKGMRAKAEMRGEGIAQAAAPFEDEKKSKEDVAGKDLSRFEEVKVRKDFSETALFKPQLSIKNGKASFSFTIPERLTSWKIVGYAITPDVKKRGFSFEAVTKKDLMVRLDMPRFFRENDTGQIRAIVSNETDREMSCEILLMIEKDGDKRYSDFGLDEKALIKSFSVRPHSVFTAVWDIKAPKGTDTFDIKAIVRSGDKTDAEQKQLPVLPSKYRLIKTSFISLDGNTKKILEMDELKKVDNLRENESLTFQIDPQLILTIINSMPLLISYPYECTEQLLNKYVPLAIINSFYKRYPTLVEAVKKLPKRNNIAPAWNSDDPLRLAKLMETPWERISKGQESYWPVIDLFNPRVVESISKSAIEKLKTYQLPNGAFPWFGGGEPSLYMTLYVLDGFAEAMKYGVKIDENMVKKAISYVNSELPKYMKPQESSTSYILYAAYILTSFPKNWAETKASFKMAETFTEFVEKNSKALTHLGKAYLVWIYNSLGKKDKADLYLERMMDGSKQDSNSGLYWSPEKISWLWYNDTIEKHAFILKTLQTFKPQDKRVEPMLKWLLFNRKGNEWKSTKATAAAIYSILEIFKNRGTLDKPDLYNANWGGIDYSVKIEPFDWLEKPIKWTKTGSDIKERDVKVIIEKQGPGFGFASLNFVFSTERIMESSGEGLMQLDRKYFLRYKESDDYRLKPLNYGDSVKVGDEIEIHLAINNKSQFEYVHLKDPKPAGFEAEELKSGWKWDKLSRYEEPRDSLTNFFMDWLPHGEYILKYRIKATTPGVYRVGPSLIQSMYAPEFSAYSSSMEIKVVE